MPSVIENALRLLNAVYEVSKGDQHSWVQTEKIAPRLLMKADEMRAAASYLFGKGLLRHRNLAGDFLTVDITSSGIDEIEAALKKPSLPTRYFPPVVNYISIGSMIGGAFQQGNAGSTQNSTTSILEIDLDKLSKELAVIRAALLDEAKTPEHYGVVGAIANAEIAANARNLGGVVQSLQGISKAAGRWVLEVGTRVGAGLAVDLITKAIS